MPRRRHWRGGNGKRGPTVYELAAPSATGLDGRVAQIGLYPQLTTVSVPVRVRPLPPRLGIMAKGDADGRTDHRRPDREQRRTPAEAGLWAGQAPVSPCAGGLFAFTGCPFPYSDTTACPRSGEGAHLGRAAPLHLRSPMRADPTRPSAERRCVVA